MDEHRVGLQPILRRVWAPRGERPVAVVHPRSKSVYIYAFVHPGSGRTYWLVLPTVSAAAFSTALAAFADAIGVNATERVLLILDGAGYHVATDVVVPEGMVLAYLPPYSPELQPAERLWALTDTVLVNRFFANLDALEDALVDRCVTLIQQPEVIHAHTSFHWWQDAA
jgi:hypothetical protein